MAYRRHRAAEKGVRPGPLLRVLRWGSAWAVEVIKALPGWLTPTGGSTRRPVLVPVLVEHDRRRVMLNEHGIRGSHGARVADR
jgi:hypothetical protein